MTIQEMLVALYIRPETNGFKLLEKEIDLVIHNKYHWVKHILSLCAEAGKELHMSPQGSYASTLHTIRAGMRRLKYCGEYDKKFKEEVECYFRKKFKLDLESVGVHAFVIFIDEWYHTGTVPIPCDRRRSGAKKQED